MKITHRRRITNMENLNLKNKEAWNAYQEDYMKFQLMERPDFFEFFSNGGVDFDEIPAAPVLAVK